MAEQDKLIEVTIWFRGVTEARVARKVANSLANAAAREGQHVQAFDNYADSPDRVDVPCRSYARICPDPIAEPYIYENHNPSVVVVTEPTLIKGCDVLKGLEPGGTLVVNTKRAPEAIMKLLRDLGNFGQLKTIATIDAGKCALPRVPYGAGEGAVDSAVDLAAAPPLLGAVARASGIVQMSSLQEAEKDKAGLQMGYDEANVLANPDYRPAAVTAPSTSGGRGLGPNHGEVHYQGVVDLIIPAPAPDGENEEMITGNYRHLRPVINEAKCTLCRNCWLFCPDSSIQIPGEPAGRKISVNLKYCKGCGICWAVCPVEGCIQPVEELDFAGDVVRFTY